MTYVAPFPIEPRRVPLVSISLFPFSIPSLLLYLFSPLFFLFASRCAHRAFAGLANFARQSPLWNPRARLADSAGKGGREGPDLNPRREDSRIEIARPLPRRNDECSRSDLRNVPGISSATSYPAGLFSDHSSTSSVPILSWSPSRIVLPVLRSSRARTRVHTYTRGRCSPLLLPGSDCYLKLCAPLIQHAIAFVPEVLISFFRARPNGVREYKVARGVHIINSPCRRLYIRCFHYLPPEYDCRGK